MKKLLLLIIALILCSSAVFASELEENHKVTDTPTHEALLKKFKRYEIFDADLYTAKSITSNFLKADKEHISDYFNTDITAYYTNTQGTGASFTTVIGIKGLDDNQYVFSLQNTEENNIVFDAFRAGAILTDKNIEDAYPLCILDAKNEFSHSVIWVKYKDGSEKILTDIKKDGETWSLNTYSDIDYLQDFIIPKSTEYTPLRFEAFSDCNDNTVNNLKKLGLLSGFGDGSFHPDECLTRAEGLKLVLLAVRSMEYIDEVQKQMKYEPVFPDVPSSHWAAKLAALGSQQQLINGFDDGLFYPESTLTELQFAKMLVCGLGYQNEAEINGGYPEGYQKIAEELMLCENPTEAPISRIDAALIVYKALCTSVNMLTGYIQTGESVSQVLSNGPTLLTYSHEIEKLSGTLEVDDKLNVATIGDVHCLIGYDDIKKYENINTAHFIKKDENGYNVWICAE